MACFELSVSQCQLHDVSVWSEEAGVELLSGELTEPRRRVTKPWEGERERVSHHKCLVLCLATVMWGGTYTKPLDCVTWHLVHILYRIVAGLKAPPSVSEARSRLSHSLKLAGKAVFFGLSFLPSSQTVLQIQCNLPPCSPPKWFTISWPQCSYI